MQSNNDSQTIKEPKYEVINNFKYFCSLIGTNKLFRVTGYGEKTKSCMSSDTPIRLIRESWKCFTYYERIK